jgi:pyruvate/2-oxoglutarate dehydrogenase complex dihydrolipoamide acyltransferase (E2) component
MTAMEIRLPKLGMSMDTATLKEWLASDGQQVDEGQPLYSVETDKSTVEVPSPGSGTLEVIGKVDTEYSIGDLIARLR